MRVVQSPDEIPHLPEAERASIRVLMTSASRGCSAKVVDALPNLGFVISQGVGTELIDMSGLAERRIRVRCVSEALTDDVADLAMALTQMLCRSLLLADAFARSGQWRQGRFEVGDSLVGMTMGIGGLSGRIGQAIAARPYKSMVSPLATVTIAFFLEGLRPVIKPALVYFAFAFDGTTIVFTFSTCTP